MSGEPTLAGLIRAQLVSYRHTHRPRPRPQAPHSNRHRLEQRPPSGATHHFVVGRSNLCPGPSRSGALLLAPNDRVCVRLAGGVLALIAPTAPPPPRAVVSAAILIKTQSAGQGVEERLEGKEKICISLVPLWRLASTALLAVTAPRQTGRTVRSRPAG